MGWLPSMQLCVNDCKVVLDESCDFCEWPSLLGFGTSFHCVSLSRRTSRFSFKRFSSAALRYFPRYIFSLMRISISNPHDRINLIFAVWCRTKFHTVMQNLTHGAGIKWKELSAPTNKVFLKSLGPAVRTCQKLFAFLHPTWSGHRKALA